jgi:hypothetical protein
MVGDDGQVRVRFETISTLFHIIRYLFEHTDIPTMRPAENVGLQVRYLIERAYEHDDCLSLDDVESVFKGVTYNGLGEVKTHPIHTIIEEARPKVCLIYCSIWINKCFLLGAFSMF